MEVCLKRKTADDSSSSSEEEEEDKMQCKTKKSRTEASTSSSKEMDTEDLVTGQVKKSLYCPLTKKFLEDPMTNQQCKHSYSRVAILQHIRKRSNPKCPVCNIPIQKGLLKKDEKLQRLLCKEKHKREVKKSLYCPLTKKFLEDPVTSQQCKHSYSRAAILQHIRKKSNPKCPVCNIPIKKSLLKKDEKLQRLLHKEKHKRKMEAAPSREDGSSSSSEKEDGSSSSSEKEDESSSSSEEEDDSSSSSGSEDKEMEVLHGYDYEFVDNPPKEMQCPICLFVLREPHLSSCCGDHFCRSCVSVIKKKGSTCPFCGTDKFHVMLDKFFARKVNELKTKCLHSKHGCEWIGELGSVQKHTDSQCKYVEVTCNLCGGHIARCHLTSHESDHCPKRPYKCEHCGREGTYFWISEVHWPVCDLYPVPCPNNCNVGTIKRQHLKYHMEKECPLECVECEFKCVGCSITLPRKDMPEHVNEKLGRHVSMIPQMYHRMTMEFQEKLEERSRQIEDLKSQVEAQKEELQAQRREMNK